MADSESAAQETTEEAAIWTAPFQALVPTPAYAGKKYGKKHFGKKKVGKYGVDYLVQKGEDLFFNETFDGNGRTCGSCHSALNNFTVDPKFIATLPDDDPLFVAENVPALADLEKPALMRQWGLILENVDSFDNPGLMRGTPHTLALNTSLTPEQEVLDAGRTHAIGWSGDGAPLPGSLRSFATGAVAQHFTTCLPRKFDGSCFRFPTEDELDALEAFQRSLGRQADPNLETLVLKGFTPTLGQKIFTCGAIGFGPGNQCFENDLNTFVPSGKCNLCHFNAGANVDPTLANTLIAGKNANLNTAVEVMGFPAKTLASAVLGMSVPCDGGFGVTANGSLCNGEGGFGTGKFNIPPLVEAPDTAPYFHNHAAKTLRQAISFYNGGFNNSPGALAIGITGFGNGIGLDESEVDAVAQFMEVVNALENIRSALGYEYRALYQKGYKSYGRLNRILAAAHAETEDAYQVLDKVPEHYGDAVKYLKKAGKFLKKAKKYPVKYLQKKYVKKAMYLQRAARDAMCEYGSDEVLCQDHKIL